MKTRPYIILLCLLLRSINIVAQDKDEILAEAWLLYNSERASWHGTDIFMHVFEHKKDKIGGYLSYTEGNSHICIFINNEAEVRTLATITFDDSFVVEAAVIDSIPRKLTETETTLLTMRNKALDAINNDREFFKTYNNTNLNLIPLIIKKKKKVYALTGPEVNGVVIFGNDYLMTLNKKNEITSRKALHKNIIPIEYSDDPGEITTMHTHTDETGDLITATDVCTLMLYCPYTNWENHYVISSKNVSIWNCENNKLFVMTKKAWEKINKHVANKK